jgi:hypothetical protein
MSALLGLINFIFMKNYITAEVTDQSQIAEEWNQLKKKLKDGEKNQENKVKVKICKLRLS